MTIATHNDLDVQTSVRIELEWTPEVDAAGIGVAVEDGAVTLSGEVDNYAEQLAAKRAALRVAGVRAVVDDLHVHPKSAWSVTETDIAKEVERALKAAVNVPEKVKAEVNGHNVTLVGDVEWNFQREAATRAVQYLRGVYTVNNQISLTARPSATDTERRVRNAIVRNAQLDAKTIDVTVEGTKITLTGTVKSWAEKTQASNAAWSSPNVTNVLNHIVVDAS